MSLTLLRAASTAFTHRYCFTRSLNVFHVDIEIQRGDKPQLLSLCCFPRKLRGKENLMLPLPHCWTSALLLSFCPVGYMCLYFRAGCVSCDGAPCCCCCCLKADPQLSSPAPRQEVGTRRRRSSALPLAQRVHTRTRAHTHAHAHTNIIITRHTLRAYPTDNDVTFSLLKLEEFLFHTHRRTHSRRYTQCL